MVFVMFNLLESQSIFKNIIMICIRGGLALTCSFPFKLSSDLLFFLGSSITTSFLDTISYFQSVVICMEEERMHNALFASSTVYSSPFLDLYAVGLFKSFSDLSFERLKSQYVAILCFFIVKSVSVYYIVYQISICNLQPPSHPPLLLFFVFHHVLLSFLTPAVAIVEGIC